MKPLLTTATIAVIAVFTSVTAWVYYPKIDVLESTAREQLLVDEEKFEPRDVRRIRIQQFDRAHNSQSDFEMVLDGNGWVIPSKGNYPADNTDRVSRILNVMRDKEILEMVSDQKSDHEQYGVLELNEAGGNGTGVGTLLSFEGRNRQSLGKLIVGSTPTGKATQRYVRLVGQPQIYVVEFNETVLTTDLADWTDGDLMRFGPQAPELSQLIDHIDVDLYFINQNDAAAKKHVYRARIRFDGNLWVYDLWQPGEDQQMPDQPQLVGQSVDVARTLSKFAGQLLYFDVRNVHRKQPDASLALADPRSDQSADDFGTLNSRGFYHAGFENGQHQFDAAAGKVTIVYRFGLRNHIYLGSHAGMDIAGGGQINRHLMLTADVDPEVIPVPEKPVDDLAGTPENDVTGDAVAEQQDTKSHEDKLREYQAAVNRRDELVNLALQRAKAFNQINADWVYVVSEEVVSRLFPPVEEWKRPEN